MNAGEVTVTLTGALAGLAGCDTVACAPASSVAVVLRGVEELLPGVALFEEGTLAPYLVVTHDGRMLMPDALESTPADAGTHVRLLVAMAGG